MSTSPSSIEQRIAKARVAGLIRAVASAENRAAIAVAKGKDAGPAAGEAQMLRAELARVLAVAEGGEAPAYTAPEQVVHRDLKPDNMPLPVEDAGAAVEAVLPRRDPRIEELHRELAAAEEPAPMRWPERPPAGSPPVAQEPPPAPERATVQATAAVLPLRPAAPAEERCSRCDAEAPLNEHRICAGCVETMMRPARPRPRFEHPQALAAGAGR